MYEITFITASEDNIKTVKKILEDNGAKIALEYPIGRKTFTYPIKKEKTGFYTTLYFEIAKDKLVDINKNLFTNKTVLRFLLTKSEQNVEEIKAYLSKEKKAPVKPKVFTNPDIISQKITPEPEISVQKNIKPEVKTKLIKEVTEPEIKKLKKVSKERIVKTKEEIKPKVAKKIKKITEPEIKVSEDQDRIKKLEEKLDELLKE